MDITKKLKVRLFKNMNKKIALLLVFSMTFSTFMPEIGNVKKTYADGTELQAETLPFTDNSSNTTIYCWKSSSQLDIVGKRRSDAEYSSQSWNRMNVNDNGMFAFSYSAGFNIKGRVDDAPITPPTGGGSTFNFGSSNNGNGQIYTLNGVEMKAVTKPSPDKRYVLLELYCYNNNPTTKYVSLRLSDDTQIGNNDGARVIFNQTEKLMHFVNDNKSSRLGNNYPEFNSIDIINSDSNIQLDEFDVAWCGHFSDRDNNNNAWASYTNVVDGDTGVSMGWKNIEVNPYEIVRKRVAFLARTTTYYVNSVSGKDETDPDPWPSNPGSLANTEPYPGSFDRPFRTIQQVINKFNAKNIKKGFICIQDPGVTVPSLNLNNGLDITIQTTDINQAGNKVNTAVELNVPSDTVFTVETGSSLTFQDITLNGQSLEREKPLIEHNGGQVSFSSGTTFRNFINKKGAAVVYSAGDNSKLSLYGATITNCKSANKTETVGSETNTIDCCAITYVGYIPAGDSDYGFEISGANLIYDNLDYDNGAKSNVYLAKDRYIQVSELLENDYTHESSRISVKTEDLPSSYVGTITSDNQERIIAKPAAAYPYYYALNNCPFEEFFESDVASATNLISVAEGKNSANKQYTVLTQTGTRIVYKYVNDIGMVLNGISRNEEVMPVGQEVNIKATPSELMGYEFDSCSVAGNGLTINNDRTSAEFGTVTGVLQSGVVTITYVFKPQSVSISFETNGGSPATIQPIEGQVGKRVNGILSTLTKYGYIFKGWFESIADPNDYTNGKISDLPATFPLLSLIFYAKYAPDPNITIAVSESHTNSDGSIVFYETPESSLTRLSVESSLNYSSLNIPGYVPVATASTVNPSRYVYRSGEVPVGRFTNSTTQPNVVNFSGSMPGEQTSVLFKYRVDTNVKKDFKVEFYKINATNTEEPFSIDGSTSNISQLSAQEPISYTPPERVGYRIKTASIVSGNVEDTANYITALTGSFDQIQNYKFIGNMPNQPAVIKYVYEPTTTNKQFVIDYVDDDTTDNRYQYIRDSIVEEHVFEDNLTASKITEYGYNFSSANVTPTSAGSFNANNDFQGTQPIDDNVTVVYHYNRNSDYFKTVTYKPSAECENSLQTTGKSSDLMASGNNATCDVLITTASGTGWSFSQITNKELVPDVNIVNTTLYQQDGFYIDTNNNCIYDDGVDQLVIDTTVFTAPVVLVPKINLLATPVSISFATDGNGTIDTTGVATEYLSIHTFADVNPKPTTNGYYYNFDGWYLNNVKVLDTDLLVNGGIYVARFKKDTSMQDELKKVLYSTSIDDTGNGVITIRDLHPNYIYLVAKEDGSIVSIKQNVASQTFTFTHAEGININTKYKLYEIKNEDFDVLQGYDNVSSITATNLSEASICYVPAVLKNYTVNVDDTGFTQSNQNIASVTIRPTSVDFEYALYENNSIVSGTEWQIGNVSGITFDNIVAGKTYNVVTKDVITGIITDSTGTVIYIDKPYTEDITEYALTIINGTSDGETTKMVAGGQEVNIETADVSFSRWVALYGGGTFGDQNSQNTTYRMPNGNAIIVAKCQDATANLSISVQNTGTASYNVILDRHNEQEMLDNLAGDVEQYLSNNGFNLSYKYRFNKDILTFEEQDQLANLDVAKRGAIAIDFDVDRYFDGQRVDNFVEAGPVPPTTYGLDDSDSQLNQIMNLYGVGIFDKVDGLYDYLLNNENIATSSEAETISTNETEDISETTLEIATESIEETTSIVETESLEEEISQVEQTEQSEQLEQLEQTAEQIVEEASEEEAEQQEEQVSEVSSESDLQTEEENQEEQEDIVDDTTEVITEEIDIVEEMEDEQEVVLSPDMFSEVHNNNIYADEPEEEELALSDDTENEEYNEANLISDSDLDVEEEEEVSQEEQQEEVVSEEETSELEEEESFEEIEEDLETTTDETVSSFTGTDVQVDYEELVQNLILFGSNFTNTIQANVYVVLAADDLHNGEYKIYKSNGALTEVPSLLSIPEDAGKVGLMAFTAEKGSRYIMTYNRYNDVVFINNNAGVAEMTGAETRLELRVKYGSAIPASATLPDISQEYTYNRATYNNGVWSYVNGSKNADDLYNTTDLIITPITLYAVYDTNAGDIEAVMEAAREALERARKVLDNYFLLNNEQSLIRNYYNILLNYYEDDTSNPVDILNATDDLVAVLNRIEPELSVREVEYEDQNRIKTNTSKTSGGGGGGGGGGGATVNSALNNQLVGQQPALSPLATTQLNGAMQPATPTQNATTNPTTAVAPLQVGQSVVSQNGMVKVDVTSDLSVFIKSDGGIASNEWINTAYGWYYSNNVGALATGWQHIADKWYYFENNNTVNKYLMKTGLVQTVNSNGTSDIYYLSQNGDMLTGYQQINGNTYYFNVNSSNSPVGAMAINTQTPDGRVAGIDGVVR